MRRQLWEKNEMLFFLVIVSVFLLTGCLSVGRGDAAQTLETEQSESAAPPAKVESLQPTPRPLVKQPAQKQKESTLKKVTTRIKNPREIPFETVELSFSEGWSEKTERKPKWHLVTNSEELKKVFNFYDSKGSLPQFDFKKSSLILIHVSWGSSCCWIRIDSIESTSATKEGTDIHIKLIESVPGEYCPADTVNIGRDIAVSIPSKYKVRKVSMTVETEKGPDCNNY